MKKLPGRSWHAAGRALAVGLLAILGATPACAAEGRVRLVVRGDDMGFCHAASLR